MNECSFPFPPYDIQRSLMREIRSCIVNRQVGIFESPTGTGKSLSVICSTMTWLEEEEQKERSQLKEKTTQKEEGDENDDSDWIAAHKRKMEKNRDIEDARDKLDYLRRIDERLRKAKENTTVGRKRRTETDKENELKKDADDDEVAPPDAYNSDEDIGLEENEDPLKVIKIFYASRTHSQLEQIFHELQKTRFRPRVVTVASRQALCANEDVRKLQQSHLINEKCMELRKNGGSKKSKGDGELPKTTRGCKQTCGYFKSDNIEEVTNGILAAKHHTPSSVFTSGQQAMGCPYFASRSAIPLCQLILLPYQVALHAQTRAAWGIDLKDNVLVLDEAHNVLQTVGALYSAELSLRALSTALQLVRQYIDIYRLRLKAKNLLYMRHLNLVVERLEKYLRARADGENVFTIQSLIIELSLTDVNLFKLVHYMEKTDLCKKFHGFYMRFQKGLLTPKPEIPKLSGVARLLAAKQNAEASKANSPKATSNTKGIPSSKIPPKSTTPRHAPPTKAPVSNQKTSPSSDNHPIPSPLYAIKTFLEALCNKCDDGRIVVEKANDVAKYRFILLNPGARLAETLKLARATVMVGGTMEPSSLLIDCLKRDGITDIRRFSCSHVIDNDQLLALIVGRSIDNNPLTLPYHKRSDLVTLRGLGLTIVELIGAVPHGTVAFFPSYGFLSFFMEQMKKNGLLKKMQERKNVFVEERGPSTELWQRFANCAVTEKGALLCAVVGGKLSEGINFSDDLGRAVLMIGLPYPNKNSVELKEKMRFLDSHRPHAGDQLFESICMHAVNQAIGRAIRHRNDYAAVFLLDSRFSSNNVRSSLSGWIGNLLQNTIDAREAVSKTGAFFKKREENVNK